MPVTRQLDSGAGIYAVNPIHARWLISLSDYFCNQLKLKVLRKLVSSMKITNLTLGVWISLLCYVKNEHFCIYCFLVCLGMCIWDPPVSPFCCQLTLFHRTPIGARLCLFSVWIFYNDSVSCFSSSRRKIVFHRKSFSPIFFPYFTEIYTEIWQKFTEIFSTENISTEIFGTELFGTQCTKDIFNSRYIINSILFYCRFSTTKRN